MASNSSREPSLQRPALPACLSSLEPFLQVIEQAPVSVVITDPQGSIVYVNDSFTRSTGYTAQEALGKNPRLLKSGEQSDDTYKALWTTITSGRSWRGEFHNRHKNGTLYWERVFVSPLRDPAGAISHFAAIKVDITETKEIERSFTWIETLFNNTVDFCCVKDLDGRLVAANRAYAAALGKTRAGELLGKTDAENFGLDDDDEPIASFRRDDERVRRLPPGEQLVREETLPCYDGRRLEVLTNKVPVYNTAGRLIATASTSTDISSLKQTEKELLQAKERAEAADKAKTAFLATMSHELRTPLNVINGIAAMLAEQDLPPSVRNSLQLIQQGGDSLLGIIEEILSFSSLRSGQIKLEERPFQLAPVLLQVLRLTGENADKKGVSLGRWVDPAAPAELVGDPHRVRQVLLNLLSNAVKFTERGRVHFSLHATELGAGRWRLDFCVQDTGIGIADEALPRLFQPFVQADDSINRRYSGTGLGLAISRTLVERMGGRISVKSRLGRGTCFRVALEFQESGAERYGAKPHPAFAGLPVLILEDDPSRRSNLHLLLRRWQANPLSVRPEAFAEKAKQLPGRALVVVDQKCLPLMEARQACRPEQPLLYLYRSEQSSPPFLPPRSLAAPYLCAPGDLSSAMLNLLVPATPSPVRPQAQSLALGSRLPLEILVADDLATNRNALHLLFEHLGYRVTLVSSGSETLDALRIQDFDLIFMDLRMPGKDGFATAREIRRLHLDPLRRPKLVALTAEAGAATHAHCIEAGFDVCLTKPVLPRTLEDCILRLYGKVRALPRRCAEEVLLDATHLEGLESSLGLPAVVSLQAELMNNFLADYEERRQALGSVCTLHDGPGLLALLHGIKGAATTLGWARFSSFCAASLRDLRLRRFKNWQHLPSQLDELKRLSLEATQHYLRLRKEVDAKEAELCLSPHP